MTQTSELYYAIYENGNNIEKNDLKSLTALSGYKYLIKRLTYRVYETTNPIYSRHFYKYFSINEDGNEKIISIGKFECLDLGVEQGYNYYSGTLCKIFDKEKNTVHDLWIKKRGIEYFYNDLIPILEELNILGSWESYMVSQENIKLRKEIIQLSDKIKLISDELSELKKAR